MLERSIRVTLHGTVHRCRVPGDDKLLECAERARADQIITGDKDLHSDPTSGQEVIKPEEYLAR